MQLSQYLSFQTPKLVVIRDWRLGLFNYAVKVGILLYIIGFSVFYKHNHLVASPLVGTASLLLEHPTMDDCYPFEMNCASNYTPIDQLPYCNLYAESVGDTCASLFPSDVRQDCPQIDTWDMDSSAAAGSTFFIPLQATTYKQIQICHPNRSNGFNCPKRFEWKHSRPPMYIPDMERFLFRVATVFETTRDSGTLFAGGSSSVAGAVIPKEYEGADGNDPDVHRKWMDKLAIPGARGGLAEFPSLHATARGTAISVGDLVALAGKSGRCAFDEREERSNSSLRQRGGVVTLHIEYSNQKTAGTFGGGEMEFSMFATLHDREGFNHSKVEFKEHNGKNIRLLRRVNGLMVVAEVHGTYYWFSLANFLAMFATSVVLLTSSTMIIDYLMMYLLHLKRKYKLLKYQPSEDFDRLRYIQDQLKSHYGSSYDPSVHKPCAQTHLLHDTINDENEVGRGLTDEETVAILMKLEQRLNRLDGMDEFNTVLASNAEDPIGKFLMKFEENYWEKAGIDIDPYDDAAATSEEEDRSARNLRTTPR